MLIASMDRTKVVDMSEHWTIWRMAFPLLHLLLISVLPLHAAILPLTGDFSLRDPSRIVRCHGRYYVYATGHNIQMYSSKDLLHWVKGQDVLANSDRLDGVPQWARDAVPGNGSSIVWAPDLLYFHRLYHLYYAFSTFGSASSVIGLVTSPTLDPADRNYRWTDAGLVVRSDPGPGCNAIDPCPIYDRAGGLWLSYGSYNHFGIGLVQLNWSTGLRETPNTPVILLATGDIEASYLYFHCGYYYLFYNIGSCCKGASSTYHVLMGRSSRISGPYIDRSGISLLDSGGSPFLAALSDKIGPGHVGIYRDRRREYLSYFFEWDGPNYGRSSLNIQSMIWEKDGWPAPTVRS